MGRFLLVTSAALLAAGFAGSANAAPVAKPGSFAMCGVCHKVDEGAPNGVGPNLWGIGDRKAGTVAGYSYSPAMQKAGISWTRDKLIAFISDPRGVVPGTKMAYAGQKDPKQAAAIADYLLSLKK
ncbi:c-type cytochrome [Flavisphingomonas formosensis]|uniref:c-type cytochrome n=1 Tax=Flavisphingomonas formosensis TaxID=861534 RepID=UPI0012F7615B|nr:c-type cytochrome [Sphingomonas formosensis]